MVDFVFDTFAWVEELAGGPHRDEVYATLLAHDVGTPDVVLAELAHYYERRPHARSAEALATVQATSVPLQTTRAIALAAGVLRGRLEGTRKGIALVDCLVLETARAAGATLLTGDAHLKGLKGVQFLGR